MVLRILLVIGKYLLIASVAALILGRLFLPNTIEDTVVTPLRQVPVVGQVLGTTWDATGTVGPSITNKTVELADKVEQTNLPIDETITAVATSEDPKKAATEIIDRQIETSLKKIENLPASAVEEIKEEIRQDIYKQICQDWLSEKRISQATESASE